MKKTKKETVFTDYELRPLTLDEREDCSNRYFAIKDAFTQLLTWIQYGLTKLKGVEITKENFKEEINKLSDNQLADIAVDIRERTQFPDKKKS